MNDQIKLLFEKVKGIFDKYEEISKISGDHFNIFQVIDLTVDEVRIHSKFLAELLNPNGSHGQGDIFLKLFTKEFRVGNFETDKAKVYVEKNIGIRTELEGGRIDILIESGNGKTIIIENKIYAVDQLNQLVRYHNYSSDNIFYLTLFGDEPSKNSSGKLLLDQDFKLLSYRDDILIWLEKCKKEAVNFPLLREGIAHYINLIRFLTGKSNNELMEHQISDFIATSPENLKSALIVSNSLEQAKIKVQYLFWKNLKNELEENGLNFTDEEVSRETIADYYQKSRNNKFYGLQHKVYQKEDIEIYYRFEIDHSIYSGFTAKKDGKYGVSDSKEFELLCQFIRQINESYQSNRWWLGWKHTETRLNFREFNSEAIFNLTDEMYLEKIIKEIVTDSIKDIHLLENKLQDNKVFQFYDCEK